MALTQADVVAAVEMALAADRARQPLPATVAGPKRDWVQVLTGAAVILTAVAAVAALFFTRQTIQQGEQGQITDRYNAAITNLASGSIDVRLGGIYALQRIMQDSPRDQRTIVDVLCAFVRNEAMPAKGRPPTRPVTDILAALHVVGTRPTLSHGHPIGCDLSGVNLRGVNLDHADLARTDLHGADLQFAILNGADFVGADLSFTNLTQAVLNNADFRHANVGTAVFYRADLTGAYWPRSGPTPPPGWAFYDHKGTLTVSFQ